MRRTTIASSPWVLRGSASELGMTVRLEMASSTSLKPETPNEAPKPETLTG